MEPFLSNAATTTSGLEPGDLKHPDVLFASACGIGYCRPAPGTWGSAAAVLVWWFWLSAYSPLIQLAICAACFFIGWWCSSRICRRHDVADAPQIVADEVAGMWLALAFLPAIWWLTLIAFGLFRALDIFKPGPIGWLDRELKGGLGVMADDVLAGIVVGIVLQLSVWLMLSPGIA